MSPRAAHQSHPTPFEPISTSTLPRPPPTALPHPTHTHTHTHTHTRRRRTLPPNQSRVPPHLHLDLASHHLASSHRTTYHLNRLRAHLKASRAHCSHPPRPMPTHTSPTPHPRLTHHAHPHLAHASPTPHPPRPPTPRPRRHYMTSRWPVKRSSGDRVVHAASWGRYVHHSCTFPTGRCINKR